MLWRDSLVVPLVQELKELRLENVALNRENVTLARDKEDLAGQVKELEDRLTAQEAAQEVRKALEVELPAAAVTEPLVTQQAPKERSWLYRWFRRG